MVQSSTKRRCDIQGVWTHSNSLVVCTGPTPLRRHDNHSEQRRNKYGDIRARTTPAYKPSASRCFFRNTPASRKRRPRRRLTKGRQGLVLPGLIVEPSTVARSVDGKVDPVREYGANNQYRRKRGGAGTSMARREPKLVPLPPDLSQRERSEEDTRRESDTGETVLAAREWKVGPLAGGGGAARPTAHRRSKSR
jgi:hypothetical protein